MGFYITLMPRLNQPRGSLGDIKKSNQKKQRSLYNSRLFKELPYQEGKEVKDRPFPENLENTIVHGTSEKLDLIPDNSVHLVVTSPPYNVGKEYDRDLSLPEYLGFLRSVFSEIYRVLV